MLDAFIIEELKKRKHAELKNERRPVLQIPIEEPQIPLDHDNISEESSDERGGNRGVIIIDYGA